MNENVKTILNNGKWTLIGNLRKNLQFKVKEFLVTYDTGVDVKESVDELRSILIAIDMVSSPSKEWPID